MGSKKPEIMFKLLEKQAKEECLATVIILDAGKTQIESGTATVLGSNRSWSS